jgi:glycosyltransferase involved in cell wall biosynthesis
VASDIDPVLEIIENERTGRIFPVGNIKQLAQAIEIAATDVTGSKAMANAAFKDATRRFDLQNSIRRLEQAYCDAIKGFKATNYDEETV